jgi:hypothetical protein
MRAARVALIHHSLRSAYYSYRPSLSAPCSSQRAHVHIASHATKRQLLSSAAMAPLAVEAVASKDIASEAKPMRKVKLGKSDLEVSVACLGTMVRSDRTSREAQYFALVHDRYSLSISVRQLCSYICVVRGACLGAFLRQCGWNMCESASAKPFCVRRAADGRGLHQGGSIRAARLLLRCAYLFNSFAYHACKLYRLHIMSM